MAIKIADNFLYQGRKPLDNRITVNTQADMVAMADAIIYDGMICYVKADKLFYVYDSTNAVDPVLAKWREFTKGGTSLKEYIQNTKYKKDDLVYLGNILAIVKTDFTSDNTTGNTIDDSWNVDETANNIEIVNTPDKDETLFNTSTKLNITIGTTTILNNSDLTPVGNSTEIVVGSLVVDVDGTIARIDTINTIANTIDCVTISSIPKNEYNVYYSTVALNIVPTQTQIISIIDIGITNIQDLDLNQLVYDADGTVGKITSIDATTNQLTIETITIGGPLGKDYMPKAPNVKELVITKSGSGYSIGDIIETTTTGIFAEVTSIGITGEITGVILSTATTQSVTGTTAQIDYKQVLYAGYDRNWATLGTEGTLAATILADNFNYEYGHDYEIVTAGTNYAIGDILATDIPNVFVKVTNVNTTGEIIDVEFTREITVNTAGTGASVVATQNTNIFVVPTKYWNGDLGVLTLTNDDGATIDFFRTGDILTKYNAGADNKIYKFEYDEVNGIIKQSYYEVGKGNGAAMKEHQTIKLLDTNLLANTVLSLNEIIPTVAITDIQEEQLVYDTKGTIAKVTNVNETTNMINVKTIAISNEGMPIAPDVKEPRIKLQGTGYTIGDIVETTTSGIFVEVIDVGTNGEILDVILSIVNTQSVTGTGAQIDYEQVIYGGYDKNWTPLKDSSVMNSQVIADTDDFEYGYDYTVTTAGTNYTVNDIVATTNSDVFAKVLSIGTSGEILTVGFTRETTVNTTGTGCTIDVVQNKDIFVIPTIIWYKGASIINLTNDNGAQIQFYRAGDILTKYAIGSDTDNYVYKFIFNDVDGYITQSKSKLSSGGTVKVSDKSGNAIEEIKNSINPNEDGIYVKDTIPLLNELLLEQKFVKDAIGEYYISYFTGNRIKTISIPNSGVNKDLLQNLTERNTNLDTSRYNTTTGEVTLKAGITYEIKASTLVVNAGSGDSITVNDSDGNQIGPRGYLAVSNYSSTSYDYIYTPTTDTTIHVEIATTTSAHSCVVDCSYFIVKQLGNKIVDPVAYLSENGNLEETPVGNIITYMGNNAPAHYLTCDGSIYNIADYQELTRHFIKEFGSINYFGGDGITTFAVPDLRGEFLRGTGTATRDTGSGSNVGTHQDPTELPMSILSNQNLFMYYGDYSDLSQTEQDNSWIMPVNTDKTIGKAQSVQTKLSGVSSQNLNGIAKITTRPTNTSVNYCIKYESTYKVVFGDQTTYKVSVPITYNFTTEHSLVFAEFDIDNAEDDISMLGTSKIASQGDAFVAPIDGYYLSTFMFPETANIPGKVTYHAVYIYKNGNVIGGAERQDDSTNLRVPLNESFVLKLKKGDTINVVVLTAGQTSGYTRQGQATFCLVNCLQENKTIELLNKPNLWVPGTEYDFGDNLYGQRFTGTYSTTQMIDTSILLCNTFETISIIETGGQIQEQSESSTPWYNPIPYAFNRGSSGYSQAVPWFDNGNKAIKLQITMPKAQTDAPYDVWVKYTK